MIESPKTKTQERGAPQTQSEGMAPDERLGSHLPTMVFGDDGVYRGGLLARTGAPTRSARSVWRMPGRAAQETHGSSHICNAWGVNCFAQGITWTNNEGWSHGARGSPFEAGEVFPPTAGRTAVPSTTHGVDALQTGFEMRHFLVAHALG